MKHRIARSAFPLVTALLLTLVAADAASAQLGRLRDAAGRAAGAVAGQMNLESLTGDNHPITTSLPHARWAVDSLDNFMPREAKRSMLELQRTPTGGFVLQPGFYEMHTQSYCLHAGTHGPGGGDGYLFAPTEGPAEDAVKTILRNSVNHPEIAQRDIQVLLWAIIARTQFEDMDTKHKATAARLLTPQQLLTLNRNAVTMVAGPAFNAALDRLPPLVRQVVEAEQQLRQMLTTPGTPFEQMERVAVLAGVAPMGAGSREVPGGRWNLHPDGYYVRYMPQGYSHTVTQVWVPQGSPSVGKEYDPATHIAVPGNTARQRLVQSGRAREQS